MTMVSGKPNRERIVEDIVRCRHTRPKGTISQFRCARPATKDGYCTTHHPDYLSPKARVALEEFDNRMEAGVS